MTDRELRLARERALSGGAPGRVRAPIRDSWLRARRLGLRADAYLPPVPFGADALARKRRAHPLAAVWPSLLDSLRWVLAESGHLLFLSDSLGHLLWVHGSKPSMRVAERVHLVPGALWSEAAAGTSGVGTALALNRPFQVLGAEHYLSAATGYTCTAAPIRDRLTGESLGVVDLTCAVPDRSLKLFSLVTMAAKLAEADFASARLDELARLRGKYADRLARCSGVPSALVDEHGVVVQSSPRGWLPRHIAAVGEGERVLEDGRPVTVERLGPGGPFLVVARSGPAERLSVRALGRRRALLTVAGRTQELTARHSEIVTLLLDNPGGLSAAELARQVYGPAGKAVTLRAELARLRTVLGYRLAANPYRLTGESIADFLTMEANPQRSAAETHARCPGPLLPGSEAPGVRAIRDRLLREYGPPTGRRRAVSDPTIR